MKGKTVKIRSGSRVEGPIVGELVDIGKSHGVIMDVEKGWMGQVAALRLVGRMTRVEDIYAKEVHLGKVSTSKKIYAESVVIEEGCVADQINYTGELKGPLERTHIEKPPTKVDHLPEPPI